MKKLFVMLFVATSLLAVSCKKDTTDGKEIGVLNIEDDIADTFHYSADNNTITVFLSPEEAEEMTISSIVFHKK